MSHPRPKPRWIAAGLATIVLAGCATWPEEPPCARFKQEQKETDYRTYYRLTQSAENAERGHGAAVQRYRLRVEPAAATTCSHVTVHKQFYWRNGDGKPRALEEVRQFYTSKGLLIATKAEPIGKQLRGSGLYVATMALPIPENAPPGKYRIVSKLVVKQDRTQSVLASSSATFQVLARP